MKDNNQKRPVGLNKSGKIVAVVGALGVLASEASALDIDLSSATTDLSAAFVALLLVSVAILGFSKINGVTKKA